MTNSLALIDNLIESLYTLKGFSLFLAKVDSFLTAHLFIYSR